LDALLLYKPKTLKFWGGSEILKGLESAARLGFENIQNPGENIKPEHMVDKTKIIRKTLTDHYMKKVSEYHEDIRSGIFTLVINNVQQIKDRLLKIMQSKYRPALEVILSQEVEGEFSSRTKEVQDRSRRLRDSIEQIEQLGNEMASVVAEVPA
jgi:hypothetical protein